MPNRDDRPRLKPPLRIDWKTVAFATLNADPSASTYHIYRLLCKVYSSPAKPPVARCFSRGKVAAIGLRSWSPYRPGYARRRGRDQGPALFVLGFERAFVPAAQQQPRQKIEQRVDDDAGH